MEYLVVKSLIQWKNLCVKIKKKDISCEKKKIKICIGHPQLFFDRIILNAINRPLRKLVEEIDLFEKDKTYYIVCQSGGRSSQGEIGR